MERVTPADGSNDQLLYFTSPSVTRDGSLYTISDRNGSPNICRIDMGDGNLTLLSENRGTYLRSYVYFDGTPYTGMGKASVSLHQASGSVYYLQGRRLMVAGRDELRPLAELPEREVTAFTHVSDDNRYICVPTTDARAFEGTTGSDRLTAIDKKVQELELPSYLHIYETESGKQVHCERVESAWVTHVQFRPGDPTQLLYNHEWPARCGVRRIWLWDGGRHLPLRRLGGGRSAEDWVCHEMWTPDGEGVIYHGSRAGGGHFLGRIDLSGYGTVQAGEPTEIPLEQGYSAYGHFTTVSDDVLVSDGYYREEGEPLSDQGRWISLQQVDWEARCIRWIPLCRHGSSWQSQDAHPHPICDPDRTHVYFTSDHGGTRSVYRVQIPEELQ